MLGLILYSIYILSIPLRWVGLASLNDMAEFTYYSYADRDRSCDEVEKNGG